MSTNQVIPKYLDCVYSDWTSSRQAFPENTHPPSQWPMPFFGNPATALVATVGVNPSSTEFDQARGWGSVKTPRAWKERLRDYFKLKIPAHEWFEPWCIGLALLGVSYEAGTAAHLDVSYRTTSAMLTNPQTDRPEFRRMVERDVQWLFKLLPICPKLRLLLTFGPVIGKGPRPEGLFGFLLDAAPKHGFKVIKDEDFWKLWHEPTNRTVIVHDADTPGEKCLTCRVLKNLHHHRRELRQLEPAVG